MKELFSNYFQVNKNTKIFYQTNFPTEDYKNKKKVLLFNYGLVCSTAHWEHQLKYFIKKKIPFIIHDYRFHYSSESKNSISECTFNNIAKDTISLLKHLEVQTSFLIGHSMGVNISLEMLKEEKELFPKVVLISGTILPPKDVMFNSNIIDKVLPLILNIKSSLPSTFNYFWKSSYLNPIVRKVIHIGGFNIDKVPEDFVTLYLKKISELPSELFFKLFEEMQYHDICDYLDTFDQEFLIISGDNDKVIPSYLQKDLHKKFKRSKYYLIRDGSHVPQWDFPKIINERISNFLF